MNDSQQWEYLFIVAEAVGSYGEEIWRPRWMNGREIEDWKRAPGLHQYANQLGSEGWELVQVGPGGDRGYSLGATSQVGVSPLPLIFKRVKREKAA